MNILGVHDGHCASACILSDGILMAAVQEERFCNKKNKAGMPIGAINWLRSNFGIDKIALASYFIHEENWFEKAGKSRFRKHDLWEKDRLDSVINDFSWPIRKRVDPYFRNRLNDRIKQLRKIFPEEEIHVINHHTAHAASAYYGSHYSSDDDVLILTADGSGDGVSSTVQMGRGVMHPLSKTSRGGSIGEIYSLTTHYLGFRAWEHEYKLMGMAPYSIPDPQIVSGLSKLIRVDDAARFVSDIKVDFAYGYLERLYNRKRFDKICASLQTWFEDIMVKWVLAASKLMLDTPVKLACAGGTFMNVKGNQVISKLEEVEDMWIFPSSGDESTSIGAAMELFARECRSHGVDPKREIQPIDNLYLGPVEESWQIHERNLNDQGIEIQELSSRDSIRWIVESLSKGDIVARCSGNGEFGARALGNRTIMAPAHNLEIINPLNASIKHRCYDDETELLTLGGWRFFKDLTGEETAATRNPETDELEYQKITDYIVEEYEGDLCVFETKRISLHVTPAHGAWVRKRGGKHFEFEYAENLTQRHSHLKGGAKWRGREQEYFTLPSTLIYNKPVPPVKIPMDLWLEFFGYWVTDGHTHNDEEGHYITAISQKKGTKKYEVIESCLEKMSFHITPSHNHATNVTAIRICNKQLYDYMSQFGKAGDKYIPRDLLTLSTRQLKILFSAMIVGDGDPRGKGYRFRSKSRQLSDDMQEISLKLGYSPNTSREGGQGFSEEKIHHVRITTSPIAYVRDKNISRRPYCGKVYCVTVPKHHLLYIRRRGKVAISGNSFWMPFAPSILEEYAGLLIENPKRLKAKWMIQAFDTTEMGYKQLKAATHPYDKTARPQTVDSSNGDYYDILKGYHEATGNMGFLNTSFNLHGYPIVSNAEIGIDTFLKSGLKKMVIGNCALWKR